MMSGLERHHRIPDTGAESTRPDLRLVFPPSPTAHGILDGCWWPRTRDPAAELPALIAAVTDRLGVVGRIALNADAWDTRPQRITTVGQQVVRLDWFGTWDAHTIRLIGCDSSHLDLLVIPPAWCPTDPTEADTCPGCRATHGVQRITGTSPKVDAGMCAACGLHWATTVINPALSIVGLLPTPQLRTAALLATLRTEVTRRSGKGPGTMTVTICLPATEVISIDAMASVETEVWWCRICDRHGTATTRPTAHSDGVEQLTAEHHATIGTAP